MTGKLRKLFERGARTSEPEPLGEDMVPSPMALAERSALAVSADDDPALKLSTGPFSSAAPAPMRDFTG